jgi:RNA polymerase sigma-70 factor (ECF subfamily)
MDPHDPPLAFPTTRWSRIAAAGGPPSPEGRQALAELCAAYWYPVYALIRRSGHREADALDLTQDYFARLLERPVLAAADPARGRFRAFLRADCGRLLADARRRARARRRGGGLAVLSIDARDAEGRYLREPADAATPERTFDRAWATTTLDAVLARLRREYEGSGRGATFEVLKVALTERARAVPHRVLAERLGTTEGAAQVAVHRLRRRYRDLVREAVAGTVADPADVEDELRDLFAALGG